MTNTQHSDDVEQNDEHESRVVQLQRKLRDARNVRWDHDGNPTIEYCIECDEIVAMAGGIPPNDCWENHTTIEEGWDNAGLSHWINCLSYLETGELDDE